MTTPITSRSLTQAEIDGYNRNDFIRQVLDELEVGKTVRFLAIKKHYNLIEFTQKGRGEYHFSLTGHGYYTYRMGDVVKVLEAIYDETNIVTLHGESTLDVRHATANADAEPPIPEEANPRQVWPDKFEI